MRKILIPILFAPLLLLALLGVYSIASGQIDISQGASPDRLVASESDGENTRAIYAPADAPPGEAPTISFIDSPTATCYQPDHTQDACYINWYYMSVSASPNYMITMTAVINEIGPVIRYHGFFQTSMYAPFNMQDRGIKVACGALGEGGVPDWGKAYAYTLRARDSANLKSANYGTVYCPAYIP